MASRKHVFTQIEKKVFLDVLKSHSAVIENKNTDGSTLRAKNVAWDSITREYNASPHVTTEVSNKQLRRLWMNLKQRQREAVTKERQHRMATGGGPSTSSAVIDPDVAQIAPALMIEIPGAIDSDTVCLEYDVSLDTESNQPELSLDNINPPSCTTMQISPPNLSPILNPTSLPLIVTPTPRIITTPPPRSTATPLPPRNTTPPLRVATTPPHFSGTTPHPSTASTPPPPIRTIPLPPPSTSSTSTTSFQRHKNSILEKEYRDRLTRAGEIHTMEKELLSYQIREAKAKAELAELILERERSNEDTNI